MRAGKGLKTRALAAIEGGVAAQRPDRHLDVAAVVGQKPHQTAGPVVKPFAPDSLSDLPTAGRRNRDTPQRARITVEGGDLADLAAATATRPATAAETSRIDLLDDRYSATTAAAAVLGATGGALVVAGAVLLTAKRRPPRAALAPWGGRGAYGLVLQGRF